MAYWTIEFKPKAKKLLDKLDKQSQHEIQSYLNEKVLKLEHPKQLGKVLTGNYKRLWRYRVDKYRIICDIQEDKLIILVIKIRKRDKAY